jgi:hypothetical protein
MDQQSQAFLSNTLSTKIPSCALSREDLRKLIDILQDYNITASDIEISHFNKNIDKQNPPKDLDTIIQNLKEAFKLRLTVTGTEGQELFGTIKEVFEHNNFPDQVLTVYINSTLALKTNYNYFPRNHFELLLDLGRPNLLDFSIAPSQPTPNNSHFKSSGLDSTWTNGIFNEVRNFISKRRSNYSWIHKQSAYDALLWFFSYPFGFWVCYKLSNFINSLFKDIFVKSAAYLYVFLISLLLIHFIFKYSRWIWPVIDFKSHENKSSKHRKVLGSIILGLVVALLWDLIKYLSSN